MDEESSTAEKDKRIEPGWVIQQKATFTRWVNQHLKSANTHIDNLETDLCDGLKLAALVEVLTNHKFKRLNKRPTFRTQKLENVTLVLKFLQENEGVRIVSIDSGHIVDSNLKLILGLIWTLIVRYSISAAVLEKEIELTEPETVDEVAAGETHKEPRTQEKEHEHNLGPKQLLLSWLKQKMPEPPIKNFTSDWNSGIAVGALVDACAPGLCPDWPDWDRNQALSNATEAMSLADDWLGVAQLVRPEELISPDVDEKAVMTYVSQFPSAKLKEGAPIRVKADSARVRAYGQGLEGTGICVEDICSFSVDASDAGHGVLEVKILNSKGEQVPCKVREDKEKPRLFSCTYEPHMEGEYQITIKYGGGEIPNSPFRVSVGGPRSDPNKVTVDGPGIERTGANRVGEATYFYIHAQDAGEGEPECVIADSNGNTDSIRPEITCPKADGHYVVKYMPKDAGSYQISVNFAGKPVPNSPFTVEIASPFNPELAYTSGRGVQPCGIRVKDQVFFLVHTERTGDDNAPLEVNMVQSDGDRKEVQVEKIDNYLWKCSYCPEVPGKYTINVRYGNKDIQNSPFHIAVKPRGKSNVVAFGPGLHAGVVGQPNLFIVSSKDDLSKVKFTIDGPSEAGMECFNYSDGSTRVVYRVSQPGEYAIHITYDNEDIPGSPYMPQIYADKQEVRINALRLNGLTKSTLRVGKPIEFYIDGLADAISPSRYRSLNETNLESVLRTNCWDAAGEPVPMKTTLRPNGQVVYVYVPTTPGTYTITSTAFSVTLGGMPCRVDVAPEVDMEKVRVWGPGLEHVIRNQATHFFIDPRAAFGDSKSDFIESNPISVTITDGQNNTIKAPVTKQTDGTYRVEYTPLIGFGELSVSLRMGDLPVFKIPMHVPVQPEFDVNQIKIKDLDPRVYKSTYNKFVVDASAIDPTGKGTVTAFLYDPSRKCLSCDVRNNNDGTYTCIYTPSREGAHTLEIKYEDVPLPKTPYKVQVTSGCDPKRVKAYGPGLESGPHLEPGKKTEFTVDLTGVGQGGLGLAVEGPKEAPIECVDNKDGTCTVYYTPPRAGTYKVSVRFNDANITGSPFSVDVKKKIDPTKVKCYGSGLESEYLRAGAPAEFMIDTRKAGEAPLQVMYRPKPGAELCPATVELVDIVEGKKSSHVKRCHKVTYIPEEEGECDIEVTFNGEHVPGSPFKVNILKACDAAYVRVFGPGVEGPVVASFPAEFTVDARNAGVGDVSLGVIDPKGRHLPVRTVCIGGDDEFNGEGAQALTDGVSDQVCDTGLFACIYDPHMSGTHTVHVKFGGEEVKNSPFTVDVKSTGRADLCRIMTEIDDAIAVNEEYVIPVKVSHGGNGRLTCQIIQRPTDKPSATDTLLPLEIEDRKDGTTAIFYTPLHVGELLVDLRFGGEPIMGGEFTQKVLTREDLDALLMRPTFRAVEFRLPAPKERVDVECTLVRPTGERLSVPCSWSDNGMLIVSFEPTSQGMHELHVNMLGPLGPGESKANAKKTPFKGSPYRFPVDPIGSGHVTVKGSGLSRGFVNQLAEFTVFTKESGGGGVTISVDGPSKVATKCVDNGDGTFSVSYRPTAPGEYKIRIKFMGREIEGSPYRVKVTESRMSHQQ
ncbi:unnamed protein product [Calicophoron daubneyi]|uniref:Calponin-homology (CH) domain-containing protein n=1 Tax=Calicophoron daubneyi TaxID=300641 RepID=A0AAV2T5B7_CALDB